LPPTVGTLRSGGELAPVQTRSESRSCARHKRLPLLASIIEYQRGSRRGTGRHRAPLLRMADGQVTGRPRLVAVRHLRAGESGSESELRAEANRLRCAGPVLSCPEFVTTMRDRYRSDRRTAAAAHRCRCCSLRKRLNSVVLCQCARRFPRVGYVLWLR
jgi:hypothetical protein